MTERMPSGVNPKWLEKRDKGTYFSDTKSIVDTHGENNIGELEFYAQHGTAKPNQFSHLGKKVPGAKSWEEGLAIDLKKYSTYRTWEFESQGIKNGRFDGVLADRTFSARALGQMIQFVIHWKFFSRHGRYFQNLNLPDFSYVAFGMALGRETEAVRLAKLSLMAYRKGYYRQAGRYPITHLMMRIMADYLQQAPHMPTGEGANPPICDGLFKLWRAPDEERLVPLCNAVLDLHTDEAIIKEQEELEFAVQWSFTPVEILLLFKLRESMELKNPTLNHPLMSPPLGVFPHNPERETDGLIGRVRDRMAQDGFDEEAIFKECYGSP